MKAGGNDWVFRQEQMVDQCCDAVVNRRRCHHCGEIGSCFHRQDIPGKADYLLCDECHGVWRKSLFEEAKK